MHQRIRMSAKLGALLTLTLLAGSVALAVPTSSTTVTVATTPTLRINEVMAANTRLPNTGTFPDMIELFNGGATAIDLSGMSLTDDPAVARKFVFPSGTTIAAAGYLVVYADPASSAPGLHTGFSLDAEGDQVRLYNTTAAGGALVDSIAFGYLPADYSISRTGARADTWALTNPSFGAANPAAGLPFGSSLASLKINEWAARITFRLDHDMIELYNPLSQPIALGGVQLTDDITRPSRFKFASLSYIGPGAYLALFGADFAFGLGDTDPIFLLGENNEPIDSVTLNSQPKDFSSGRNPDGSSTITNFGVPTPGMSNPTPLPANHDALLKNLRITEVMYQPAAATSPGDYEFVELQNIGPSPLDLSGVRFTNGIDYPFPAGTTLAGGAFIVVAKDRTAFLSRYPSAAGVLAPGAFTGALDNNGETLALTLPAPWYVHILRFRYESNWFAGASGGGYSLVVPAPATTAAADWKDAATWRQSVAINGSPGAADTGAPVSAGVTARLSNLSVRTALGAGQNLIVGFFVDGGSRSVLVRAAGPALTALGVGGAMGDPRLELFNSSGVSVLTNDDWNASLAPVFQSVGAFAFPAGSFDAAFTQGVSGAVSVHARGTGAGIVLVEAYDTGTTNSPRMTNLSARNRVGTGDEILIAGFAISGTGSKRLLIRAAGPALTALGVPNVLTDPKLELYNSSAVKVTENDNWTADLAATFSSVGAFAFPANSRDSALIVTLNSGATYTVQVRGTDGGTGEALVEVYEIP